MRILVLAPHPFYQERGTPIDVDLLLAALSRRPDTQIDLLTFPEGEDREYPGVRIHRIPDSGLVRGLRPGFGFRKLLGDVLMAFAAWRLVRARRYDVIHAGEEAAFIALLLERRYGIPFVYDLDSSVAQQMVEKYRFLRVVAPVLDGLEALAIRSALATAPVCNALADLCHRRGAAHVQTLHDISQLERPGAPRTGKLAEEIGTSRLLFLYVGNLEPYQGVDLLLEAFALAAAESDAMDLVIIGGAPEDLAAYRRKAAALGIADRAQLLGPRPFRELDGYLAEADVLVAPRIRGVNTPMKVFPYLHSGKAVLVTDLPTHSQILTDEVAVLAPPEPRGFADAILRLAADGELRERIGRAGQRFVEREHTFPAHCRRVDALYDWVEAQIGASRAQGGGS